MTISYQLRYVEESTSRKRGKVALEAVSWYNKVINIVVSGGAANTPDRIRLIRRPIMDSLRPRDENGKFLPVPPSPIAVSGIYQITNIITGDFYIGSSANIKERWREHIRKLKRGNYGCVILQRAWNKYGEAAFTFSIIEVTEKEKAALLTRENYYIQTLHPVYNCTILADSHLGMKRSEETKEKLRNRVYDEEFREKQRQANLGKKPSEETRAKLRQSQKARYANIDPIARQAQIEAQRAAAKRPETQARMREAQKINNNKPGARERQRQSHLGVPKSPEHLENWRKSRIGHSVSEETREKK